MKPLTSSQKRVLDFIRESSAANGVPPSVREICAGVGLSSTSTVFSHIRTLTELGYLTKQDGKSRCAVPSEKLSGGPTASVPLLGTVTAGAPILAEQNIDGYVQFSPPRGSTADLFALRVRGESMINAGILNGDIVIVRQTAAADNGDIVVAWTEEGATVKRFFKENGHFRLQPENDHMAPIITRELTVLGRVICSLRYYE
ncbi:MAG: transcriptional repressor LexA [Clostridia bacterium]|nr:transcriptional repressor LexA [Clostridia bacterium]